MDMPYGVFGRGPVVTWMEKWVVSGPLGSSHHYFPQWNSKPLLWYTGKRCTWNLNTTSGCRGTSSSSQSHDISFHVVLVLGNLGLSRGAHATGHCRCDRGRACMTGGAALTRAGPSSRCTPRCHLTGSVFAREGAVAGGT